MKQSAGVAISLLLGLLADSTKVAAREDLIVEAGGIDFEVRRFDDGRSRPYDLKFKSLWEEDTITSKFRFVENGQVRWFKADTEKYVVKYWASGSLKKVVRKDAGGRMLLGDERPEEAQLDLEDNDEEHGVTFDHRRLYACGDCWETWDLVCNVGVPTICDLVGNEVIGDVGDSSVLVACETFGSACSSLSADDACEGQCTPEGTPAPTPSPVPAPTPSPVAAPTPTPVAAPTPSPVAAPTPSPVAAPTPSPVAAPTPSPVAALTPSPVAAPTPSPVAAPTPAPVEDACSANPCLNGGSCDLDIGGGHVCSCPSGYGGMACQTDTSSLAEFYITVEFAGTWTAARQAVFQDAADRWAEIITHVPCGGTSDNPAGQLLITATLSTIDGVGGVLGSAGPSLIWTACRTISLAGDMTFDIDDIADMEADGILEGVILHEMGHVIGAGTLWGDCSTCRADGDSDWKCPGTVGVYNDLLGDPDGTNADIIELDGESGTACGHFDEDIFDDELMTGFVDSVMYLSKMTAASLDDTGYIVDASQADSYVLPALRSGSAVGVGPDEHKIGDVAIDTRVGMMDEDGNVVGHTDSVMMEFY